ncbi:MAG: hypothetical protein ACLGHN_14470 [Bacteriovoracia bacterium]
MHTFIILLVFVSLPLFAQETFEQKIEKAQAQLQTKLMHARTSSEFKGYPNDQYVEAFGKVMDDHMATILSLHEKHCEKTPAHCLSPQDIELKQAQNRIDKGLVSRKNEWAQEGLSADDQKEKEAEYKREEAINLCAEFNKECDKLSESDRAIARERSKKPEVSVDAKKTPEEEQEELEKKLEADLQKLADEFKEKFPEMNAQALIALKEFEAKKLEMTFALYDELCKKYPNNEDMCLSPEEKDIIRDMSAGQVCFAERSLKLGKKIDSTKHDEEWSGLAHPKNCQTLIDKDKAPVEKPVTTDSDDEKNPRNFKSDTCKWVTDLPKKIVNGPGCSLNSRSRICTGYVICDQKSGGGKFIRMSTCRPDFCGNTQRDAINCTQDKRYFSEKPWGEEKMFMSPKLKEILSGASEQ